MQQVSELRQSLAIIPAKSNSIGCVGKNGRVLGGRTLVQHACDVAHEAGIGTVCVTTDGEWLADGCVDVEVISRPPWLADETAVMANVVSDTIAELWRRNRETYQRVILLQPTSPLRTAEIVRSCHQLSIENTRCVVSVTPTDTPPAKLCYIDINGCLTVPTSDPNRQAHQTGYKRDGVCYVITGEVAKRGGIYGDKPIPFVTPAPRGISIDTEEDWREVERIYADLSLQAMPQAANKAS